LGNLAVLVVRTGMFGLSHLGGNIKSSCNIRMSVGSSSLRTFFMAEQYGLVPK
jgi:hypothetical protein